MRALGRGPGRDRAAAHRDQERAGAVRARQRHRPRRSPAGRARHREGPSARRSPRPRRRQLPLRGSPRRRRRARRPARRRLAGAGRRAVLPGVAARPDGRRAATPLPLAATASWSGSTTRCSTSAPRARPGSHLVGEGALLAALDAPRTGRMQDVVATIQAEQDVVIRRPRAGVTVVQGAPGTGKTAVALHRAAYLLYAERARLAGAVLFVGPSATFLRYVEDVVPSLGEDRVVLATPADLGPAVAVSKVDPPAAAAVKGDLRMVDVLARAVRAHERAPRAGIELWAGSVPPRGRATTTSPPSSPRRGDGRATHNGGRPLVRAPPPAGAGSRVPERPRARPPDRPHRPRSGPVRATAPRRGRPRRAGAGPPRHLAAAHPRSARAPSARVAPAPGERRARHPHGRRAGRAARARATATTDGARPTSPSSTRPTSCSGPLPTRRRARQRTPTVARPRGRADPGGAAARLPAVRAPARVPAGRGVRQRPAGLPGVQGDVRHDRRSWVTPPPTSCTACTRSSPTSSTSTTCRAVRPADARYGHVVVDEAQDLSPMQWRAIARRCPTAVVHARRRRGAGGPRRRGGDVGPHPRGARRRRGFGGPPRAHGQLPHPGRGHGAGGPPARAVRTAPAPGPLRPDAPGSVPAASTPVAGRSARRTSRTRSPTSGATSAPGWSRSITPEHLVADRDGDAEHLTAVDAKGLGVRRRRRRRSRGHRPRVTGGDRHGAPLRRPHPGDDQADDPRPDPARPAARGRARSVRAGARAVGMTVVPGTAV